MKKDMVRDQYGDLVEIQWWEAIDFWGRTTEVRSLDTGELLQSIPIPDRVIVCDLCNADVLQSHRDHNLPEFPVPVMRGSYAPCYGCTHQVFPNLVRQ